MSDSMNSQNGETKPTLDGNKLVLDLDSIGIDKYFDGTKRESFMTNDAKVELVLREYCDAIRWRTDIIGVIGVIVAILLTLITGSFKASLGIGAATWSSIFIFILLTIVLFFIYTLIHTIRHRKDAKIENVVIRLRDRSLGRN